MSQNRVPENVEHVVSVVGQSEGVDDCAELYDEEGAGESDACEQGDEEIFPHQAGELRHAEQGVEIEEEAYADGDEDREGEEYDQGPDVEELREVDGCYVAGFVAWWVSEGFGV